MSSSAPKEIFRKDYQAPDFSFESVELTFRLGEKEVEVVAKIQVQRLTETEADLVLHGEDLELRQLKIDDVVLEDESIEHHDSGITLPSVPLSFCLETTVAIKPQDNTQLSGLYKSSGNFCTQCEAEGFRRITYFLDRPDVMTSFRVRMEGDQEKYPVLLSNGNLLEKGKLSGGRHFAVWDDPFKKPSYLFALVAGDLGSISGSFQTQSGRQVDLFIYSEPGNENKLEYALSCLQSAMRWDEETYGLEYDLDIYNIVAVGDFNMGAMENKSLNIFNTAYVLARPDTATDNDYEGINGVIAHEYFHNWTGNRVTCQDWFQLTLKEGLTVFRDQRYSADMTSEAVKRIEDVRILRALQFAEDAGPMSHPIRPDSYVAMDNFYTSTVYNKGAEVIRMYQTLLGVDGFRKGLDLYFERHDGQAVTCVDFRNAMADANHRDLSSFDRWYSQSGTPEVSVQNSFNAETGTCSLNFKQSCPATPGQAEKLPFPIPVAVGFLDEHGHEVKATSVCLLDEEEKSFDFEGFKKAPIPSVLRGFSAPVKLRFEESSTALGLRLAHDSDPFSRWEAGQKLATYELLGKAPADFDKLPYHVAFGALLAREDLDYSLQAYALRLPDLGTLAEELEKFHPQELADARREKVKQLARGHASALEAKYHSLSPQGPFEHSPEQAGRRRLRNLCLSYLTTTGKTQALDLAVLQFDQADNMTDQAAAVACLAQVDSPQAEKVLDQFYQQWKDEPLVVDKWLSIQASADRPDVLKRMELLRNHPAFDIKNPNKVRSLIRVFFRNISGFHQMDGAGYAWIADRILELDSLNPQLAARVAGAFTGWRRLEAPFQERMKEQLTRISKSEGLSKDTWEIVSKSL